MISHAFCFVETVLWNDNKIINATGFLDLHAHFHVDVLYIFLFKLKTYFHH